MTEPNGPGKATRSGEQKPRKQAKFADTKGSTRTRLADRGSQYTSVEFGSRLKAAGLLPSMRSVADAYDNSMAESFVSTLKRELIHRHSWPNRQTARTAIFEYIEGFYNTRRRHSALGHLSPSDYEEVRLRGGAVA